MDGQGFNNSPALANSSVQSFPRYGWLSWLYWGYISYHICAEFVCLILQLTILLTILLSKTFQNLPNYYLLINLALGSVVWICIVTPFHIVTFFYERWKFGTAFCVCSGYWTYTLSFQYIITLALMTAGRYSIGGLWPRGNTCVFAYICGLTLLLWLCHQSLAMTSLFLNSLIMVVNLIGLECIQNTVWNFGQ